MRKYNRHAGPDPASSRHAELDSASRHAELDPASHRHAELDSASQSVIAGSTRNLNPL